MTEPPLLCLMGPTAAGKSALALALAEQLPVELVTVDSAQVYRTMDIGTAKPSAAERALVAHHLLDLVDPLEAYSAARFVNDALAAIADIRRRGKHPVLVGGTMLYYRALLHGLSQLPESDPLVRAELEARAAREGWVALHAELAVVDGPAAARIHPNDPQRLLRALEVYQLSGRPLSSLQNGGQPAYAGPVHAVAVALADRALLHQRIDQRFRAMLDDGLIDEVETLRARGDLHLGLPSMRCVGYRQVWEYLEGHYERAALIERGVAATRQLAKRQLTWLRSWPAIDWVEAGDSSQIARLVALLR
ncbi:MAG: tRNA (adenosine(37)-N6)-dimethylallyltransferase MiaA [Gammaproteobacteria bacterium]|nr:tRNA (adenosine(37)-N6)-dimethylallyltransferase MiaA [Gammaproteobacteria bacterium]